MSLPPPLPILLAIPLHICHFTFPNDRSTRNVTFNSDHSVTLFVYVSWSLISFSFVF